MVHIKGVSEMSEDRIKVLELLANIQFIRQMLEE